MRLRFPAINCRASNGRPCGTNNIVSLTLRMVKYSFLIERQVGESELFDFILRKRSLVSFIKICLTIASVLRSHSETLSRVELYAI